MTLMNRRRGRRLMAPPPVDRLGCEADAERTRLSCAADAFLLSLLPHLYFVSPNEVRSSYLHFIPQGWTEEKLRTALLRLDDDFIYPTPATVRDAVS